MVRQKNIKFYSSRLLFLFALVLLACLFQPLLVLAGPPAPFTFTITQPNGTASFEAQSWGNEHVSGLETTDGYTVLQNPIDGFWYYAAPDHFSGQLIITDKIAGIDSPPISAYAARPLTIQRSFASNRQVASSR